MRWKCWAVYKKEDKLCYLLWDYNKDILNHVSRDDRQMLLDEGDFIVRSSFKYCRY